ncbi:MAG: cadmium-translocating P-type ATPase [Actinomycetota bacterium]|nr:cadmium-translocating P-type ATPase [Actinomycetota bacterium]
MSAACCGHEHGAGDTAAQEPQRLRDVREIRLAVLAGTLLATGLVLAALGAGASADVAFLAALVAGGLTFVPQAARGLLRRRLGVDTLMAVAAVGAVILGNLGEAATLAFLFSISEALESYALTRTRRGLRALLDLVPARATVRRGGCEQELDPTELVVGDRLVVRPGERLATDGVVHTGRSAVDLSAVTGESMPVERGPGDEVFAAAVNGRGALEIDVTARSEDNSLARIVRIVEEAQERKGAGQRLAERIARPLVPGVLMVAALVALAGSLLGSPDVWIERALVILVAAAPCAFAISVPVTVVAAIGAATRSGVLIKGGAALEALGAVRAVAFDKTGTLTRNAPAVVAVATVDGIGRENALGLAAALEARSEHPLARAILTAAPDRPPGESVQALPGQGIVGEVSGAAVRLGHPGFVHPGPLAGEVARLQDTGATVIVLEHDAEPMAAIAVRDDLRPEAAEAVGLLARAGMAEIAMVSGDNDRTARALAAQAGIATVHAEQRPEHKVEVIEAIRARRPVAMVGDGINDAPALASANVGIAMGAMGTDVAIEAADVALMGDDLRHLDDTFAHARRAGRIMRQNLALSGGILLALVPLAATGTLGLAAVVAVHELAEIAVIANGVRAGRRGAFVRRGAPAHPTVPAARDLGEDEARTEHGALAAIDARAG